MSCASPLKGISSMATRAVLAELAQTYAHATGEEVYIESVGGVDAARRVAAGEVFDAVFLADDAIEKLTAQGHVLPGSRVELMRSGVCVAVPHGAVVPDIANEAALRGAVMAASSVGYSTGPSGTALLQLFERWGVSAQLQARLVQAPPGVPVGQLVAQGQVALGFQQTSELLHVGGITIVGPLPEEVAIVTTFCGAICSTCCHTAAVRAMLEFFASPAALAAKQRQGMQAATAPIGE